MVHGFTFGSGPFLKEWAVHVYSNSRLETFETCPLKYKFKYLDRIQKSEEQTIEALVGTCVHQVLRKLYDDLLLSKLNSLDELLAYYRACWEERWKPEVKMVRTGLAPENYSDYGALCLRNYY